MAGQRLTDKSALANNPASADLLMVVDVSDTTGSAVGTSKKVIAPYMLTTEKVVISQSAFRILNTNATTLVTAVASKVIQPISVYIELVEGATPNLVATDLRIGHTALNTSYYWAFAKRWSLSPTYNKIGWIFDSSVSALGAGPLSLAGLGLYLYLSLAPTGTTTCTATVWTTYRLLDIT